MIPEEQVHQYARRCNLQTQDVEFMLGLLQNAVAEERNTIHAAVAEERETCARLVDADESGEPTFERMVICQILAAAIRARKDGA